jgi:hypothetical protein
MCVCFKSNGGRLKTKHRSDILAPVPSGFLRLGVPSWSNQILWGCSQSITWFCSRGLIQSDFKALQNQLSELFVFIRTAADGSFSLRRHKVFEGREFESSRHFSRSMTLRIPVGKDCFKKITIFYRLWSKVSGIRRPEYVVFFVRKRLLSPLLERNSLIFAEICLYSFIQVIRLHEAFCHQLRRD